jgi:cytochrome P450
MTTNTAMPLVGEVAAADWIDPAELVLDPYPTYERLRRESPVAWVPSLNRVLVSTYELCQFGGQNPHLFSNDVRGALMVKAFQGKPMLRLDDPDHARHRGAINPTLRPRKISEVWAPKFEANARTALVRMTDERHSGDLNLDFAGPVAAMNLIDLVGFRDVDAADMVRWSSDFIAGAGNVLEDEEIWAKCVRSRDEVDEILDDLLPYLEQHPDDSITSMLVQSGMEEIEIRANVKLVISGGMNEPQHMVTNMVAALEEHPDQKAAVLASPDLWAAVFTETVRWQAPVGMLNREATQDIELGEVTIPKGASVGFLVASACRDGQAYPEADRFNIHRQDAPHFGFGTGVHMCAGRRAAELAIGRIAVPLLYSELPNLRLDQELEPVRTGFAFRGLSSLPVRWD